jgi:putative ABC transport system permease protein
MKVVLFAGGQGTRLREYDEKVPKPMVSIGYRPIMWHLLKYYAHYGHTDFIVCLGYKADVIKRYFLAYDECLSNNFVMAQGGKKVELLKSDIQDWRITFVDTGIASTIGELSRGSTSAPSRARARDLLVVGQIAATLVLLVGAAVLGRSFLAVRDVRPGFNPHGVLSVNVAIPPSRYVTDRDITTFFTRVLDGVEALPGVTAAAIVNRLPLGGGNQTGGLEIEGGTVVTASPNVQTRAVAPGYFRALEIPLHEGRAFARTDDATAPAVAIVDERIARALWPNRSALGQRIREGKDGPWSTIIGVVGHVRHTALDDDSEPQVYWNYAQRPDGRMTLVVKAPANAAALAPSVAAVVRSIDAEQPIYDAMTLDDVVDRSLGERRFQTLLLGVFASIALVLASIGADGVIAYGVGQRLREFGVRIALGARRRDVVLLVIRRGGLLFGAGAMIGLVASAATVRVLATLVYGVSPHDGTSFVAATLVLLVVSLLACYVPARRAARGPVHSPPKRVDA